MSAQTWIKTVPATAGTTAIPLTFWKLIQESLPVYKARVTTVAGGVAVPLPAAFTAVISSANEYGVQHSKETFDPDGGEIKITNKTTSGFKVENTGETYGEIVFITVYWIPA